jgi:hypothetical protein
MPRVSTKRQGVIATKVRAFVDTAFAENRSCGTSFAATSLSAWLGCQNRGVDQFFSGTTFSCVHCPFNIKGRKARRETAQPEYLECIS